MRENLCEIRNCGGNHGNSKFRTFFGGVEIKECPVSYISGWTNSILNEFFSLKQLKDLGLYQNMENYSAKELEAFLVVKNTMDRIEIERIEKENRKRQSIHKR